MSRECHINSVKEDTKAGELWNILNTTFWIVVILIYYVLATLLPIDKIIGKLYPIFDAVLIITVACGAISGFHATQSPMIAKCITSEKLGRENEA